MGWFKAPTRLMRMLEDLWRLVWRERAFLRGYSIPPPPDAVAWDAAPAVARKVVA